MDTLKNPCSICGEREANIEDTICYECKKKVNGVEFDIERAHFEKRMLDINHKGTWCWFDVKVFCQEGWCVNCNIYVKEEK